MLVTDELRALLGRLLGWSSDRNVEQALRSLELALAHRAHLVLRGAGDLVPIASALHRRTLGPSRPFVVCDPRRGNTPASVRSPANHDRGLVALEAAAGGSLCMRGARLPRDFESVVAELRARGDAQYIVCEPLDGAHPLLVVPAPIEIPSLHRRTEDLPRIVDEYAEDAVAALAAPPNCFGDNERAWILKHAATSLSEIEKATLRVVAFRASTSLSHAATRLGMAAVSLSRWLRRRPTDLGQPTHDRYTR